MADLLNMLPGGDERGMQLLTTWHVRVIKWKIVACSQGDVLLHKRNTRKTVTKTPGKASRAICGSKGSSLISYRDGWCVKHSLQSNQFVS